MVNERHPPTAGRLAGARVIITGAARGIGAAIAETFATEGARLALLDREGDQCRATAQRLGADALEVDLADPESARDVTQAAIDALGGIDVLVNNAGILHMAPLLDITVDDWDRTFDINVRAMLLTTQVAARAMISATPSGGSIINMASMGGKLGSPNQAHYAASKAAVISLTRVSAMELGTHGIRVNCICPGYVLTEMGAATRTPEMVARWSAMSPLGRCAEPAEVADMALFLASQQARYCTGQAMNVSGGMVMH
ncbi:MAG TPA: SDR family NAD(P)-dependent oxidoreductase [Ilumatobacteraceae bacterium]|nr:SDR family NAD(P)-dependent oxidoreductase [Ilumatobacteraceae bacterium]HRB02273.1 SDR family NAD(P)-dependent oxidoreductase [Ilumatobacteraceae bacterium]